jgi:hypothetical protein
LRSSNISNGTIANTASVLHKIRLLNFICRSPHLLVRSPLKIVFARALVPHLRRSPIHRSAIHGLTAVAI